MFYKILKNMEQSIIDAYKSIDKMIHKGKQIQSKHI